ncbi:hypothetical protein M8T07_18335 [Enterobacter hormaechei]|nr:hypothetical protein [Enterobacter hormaechei]
MTSQQNKNLRLTLLDGGNRESTIDFDCYNFPGFPAKKPSLSSQRVLRPISADTLFISFRDADYADATKFGLIANLRKYVAFCDSISLPVFAHESVMAFGDHIVQKTNQVSYETAPAPR